MPRSPEWISESPLLCRAYELAERSHRGQLRASDGRPFLDHVVEVATLLHEAGFDEEVIAAGLLHDSVERGTLTDPELRLAVGDEIADVVMTLTEDAAIEPFDARKAALRRQVAAAGGRALTVFAADKLSDILGLRRGIEKFGKEAEGRLGTTVPNLAGHYRDSVAMIEAGGPGSVFLAVLRAEIELLGAEAPAAELRPAERDGGRGWTGPQRARLTG